MAILKKVWLLVVFSWGHACVAGSDQASPLVVFLDWSVNPHHAPLLIAHVKGFFKRTGRDIKICPAVGSEEGARHVSFKQADVALCSQPRFHYYQKKGLPLVVKGVIIHEPLEVFVSKTEHPQRIGMAGNPLGFSGIVLQALQNHLSSPISFKIFRGSLVAGLIQGSIDAAMDLNKTYDLALVRKYIPSVTVMPLKAFHVPEFDQLILLVHPDNAHATWLSPLLEGLKEAIRWIKDDPETAWCCLVQHYPELSLYEDNNAWKTLVSTFADDPAWIDEARYEAFERYIR